MADPIEDAYEAFHFTPTEDLIIEVLTARTRLGNQVWTFESRNNKALNQLEVRGLVGYKSASVEGYSLVWFTADGIKLMFGNKYHTPIPYESLKQHQKDLKKRARSAK